MIDRKKLFDGLHVAPFTGGMSQGQVDGINAILDCWDATYRVQDPLFVSYSLATVYWETAKTMQPIEEYGKGAGHPYGLPTGPWHKVYDGRGYVQLTWQANYAHASKRLGELGLFVDLEKNPELAMQPDIAARILVIGMVEGWFTGKKLGDYFSHPPADPINARRIINGTDNANTIAHIYSQFQTAIAGAWVATVPPITTPPTHVPVPSTPIAQQAPKPPVALPVPYSEGPLAAILRLLITLLTTLFPRKV
jgi:putative chitinase